MQMTNEEICRDYRQAKNKFKQIKILSELNQCKPDEIISILKNEGVQVGSRTTFKLNETAVLAELNPNPATNSEPVPADWKTSLKTVTERITELKLIRDSAEKELSEIYQALDALCGKENAS